MKNIPTISLEDLENIKEQENNKNIPTISWEDLEVKENLIQDKKTKNLRDIIGESFNRPIDEFFNVLDTNRYINLVNKLIPRQDIQSTEEPPQETQVVKPIAEPINIPKVEKSIISEEIPQKQPSILETIKSSIPLKTQNISKYINIPSISHKDLSTEAVNITKDILEKPQETKKDSVLERIDEEIKNSKTALEQTPKTDIPSLTTNFIRHINLLRAKKFYTDYLNTDDEVRKKSMLLGYARGLFDTLLLYGEKEIPAVGGLYGATENIYLQKILEKPDESLTPFERALKIRYITEQLPRKASIPYQAGLTTGKMAGYATELYLLGLITPKNLASSIYKFTRIGGLGPKLSQIVPRLTSALVIGAYQGAVNIPRLAEKTAENMLPQQVDEETLEFVDKRKDFLPSLLKAWGTQAVEYATERLGVLVERPLKFLEKAIISKGILKFGKSGVEDIIKRGGFYNLMRKIGITGLAGEVSEEEIAEPFQAMIEGRQYKHPFTPEGFERLLVETLGIGAFKGIGSISDTIISKINQNRKKYGSVKYEIKENNVSVEKETPEDIRKEKEKELYNVVKAIISEIGITSENLEKDEVLRQNLSNMLNKYLYREIKFTDILDYINKYKNEIKPTPELETIKTEADITDEQETKTQPETQQTPQLELKLETTTDVGEQQDQLEVSDEIIKPTPELETNNILGQQQTLLNTDKETSLKQFTEQQKDELEQNLETEKLNKEELIKQIEKYIPKKHRKEIINTDDYKFLSNDLVDRYYKNEISLEDIKSEIKDFYNTKILEKDIPFRKPEQKVIDLVNKFYFVVNRVSEQINEDAPQPEIIAMYLQRYYDRAVKNKKTNKDIISWIGGQAHNLISNATKDALVGRRGYENIVSEKDYQFSEDYYQTEKPNVVIQDYEKSPEEMIELEEEQIEFQKKRDEIIQLIRKERNTIEIQKELKSKYGIDLTIEDIRRAKKNLMGGLPYKFIEKEFNNLLKLVRNKDKDLSNAVDNIFTETLTARTIDKEVLKDQTKETEEELKDILGNTYLDKLRYLLKGIFVTQVVLDNYVETKPVAEKMVSLEMDRFRKTTTYSEYIKVLKDVDNPDILSKIFVELDQISRQTNRRVTPEEYKNVIDKYKTKLTNKDYKALYVKEKINDMVLLYAYKYYLKTMKDIDIDILDFVYRDIETNKIMTELELVEQLDKGKVKEENIEVLHRLNITIDDAVKQIDISSIEDLEKEFPTQIKDELIKTFPNRYWISHSRKKGDFWVNFYQKDFNKKTLVFSARLETIKEVAEVVAFLRKTFNLKDKEFENNLWSLEVKKHISIGKEVFTYTPADVVAIMRSAGIDLKSETGRKLMETFRKMSGFLNSFINQKNIAGFKTDYKSIVSGLSDKINSSLVFDYKNSVRSLLEITRNIKDAVYKNIAEKYIILSAEQAENSPILEASKKIVYYTLLANKIEYVLQNYTEWLYYYLRIPIKYYANPIKFFAPLSKEEQYLFQLAERRGVLRELSEEDVERKDTLGKINITGRKSNMFSKAVMFKAALRKATMDGLKGEEAYNRAIQDLYNKGTVFGKKWNVPVFLLNKYAGWIASSGFVLLRWLLDFISKTFSSSSIFLKTFLFIVFSWGLKGLPLIGDLLLKKLRLYGVTPERHTPEEFLKYGFLGFLTGFNFGFLNPTNFRFFGLFGIGSPLRPMEMLSTYLDNTNRKIKNYGKLGLIASIPAAGLQQVADRYLLLKYGIKYKGRTIKVDTEDSLKVMFTILSGKPYEIDTLRERDLLKKEKSSKEKFYKALRK